MKIIIINVMGLFTLLVGMAGADTKELIGSTPETPAARELSFFPNAPTDSRLGFLKHVYHETAYKFKGEETRRQLKAEFEEQMQSSSHLGNNRHGRRLDGHIQPADCTQVQCRLSLGIFDFLWNELLKSPRKTLVRLWDDFDWNPSEWALPCNVKFDNGNIDTDDEAMGMLSLWADQSKNTLFGRVRVCTPMDDDHRM